MATNVKILRKVAIQVQSGSSFEKTAMFIIPHTSHNLKTKPVLIDDDSYVGLGFIPTPSLGYYEIAGTISFNVEKNSIKPILEATLGTATGTNPVVYTFADANTKRISLQTDDGVAVREWGNCFIQSLKISGAVGQNIVGEMEVFGITQEDRTGNTFAASPTMPNSPFVFHEMDSPSGGTGYLRIADHADALASGDNQSVDSFSIEMTTGLAPQYDNGRFCLAAVYGMVRPTITGTVTLSRHAVDTFLDARDNVTKQQMDLYLYRGATEYLRMRVPTFLVETDVSDEDTAKVSLPMRIGRNGYGTTYVNSNTSMTFTSPIQISVY